MESPPITFEQLPTTVYQLVGKVDRLTALLESFTVKVVQPAHDRWMSVEELCDYLPGAPAQTTIYGKVQRKEIPYKREGKRLIFLQSEIDAWLMNRGGHTNDQIKADAAQHIATPQKAGRKPTKQQSIERRGGRQTA